MQRKPFEKKDTLSMTEKLVMLVQDGQPGEFHSNEFLADYLICDTVEQVQSAIFAAREAVLLNCKRKLVPVPNKGYKIATASEQIGEALRHTRKAKRQVSFELNTARYTKVHELPPELKALREEVIDKAAMKKSMLDNVEVRISVRASLKAMMEA